MGIMDDRARTELYAQAAGMQGVPATKYLRQHLGTSLVESLDIAHAIARDMPNSPLGRSLAPRHESRQPREHNAIIAEIEKVIAGACFPSNPDMSGDPRKRLGSSQLRRVEDCAISVMDVFLQAGFTPSPAPKP